MNKEKIELMRSGKVSTALLKLGLPAVIGMISGALFNVIDAYFVGGLGTSSMGAVSVTFPLVMILIGIGLTFGSGAGSYISRLLGEGNNKQADRTASTAVFSATGCGIIIITLMLIFMDRILISLGATSTILPPARDYALIYLYGGIFQIFYVTMNNISISEGASRISMTAMLISVGLNIILDPVFIYTMGMGIKGAAVATVISQATATVFYLHYILAGKGFLRFSFSSFSLDRVIFSQIFRIGVPILLLQIATSLSIALTNASASSYGDNAVAAMGAVTRISTLGAYTIFGFVKGFQPMAGFSYGSGNIERLKETIKISLIWTTVYCSIASLIMIFLPEPVISIFSKNDIKLVEIGSAALRANGFAFFTFGFQMVFSTLFLAMGKGREGGILSMSRQGIFFIPLILILPEIFGLKGLIYTQMAADFCTVILTLIIAVKWKSEIEIKQLKIR